MTMHDKYEELCNKIDLDIDAISKKLADAVRRQQELDKEYCKVETEVGTLSEALESLGYAKDAICEVQKLGLLN